MATNRDSPDAIASSTAPTTLVDTGVLTIQEVRGPDQLPDEGLDRKLNAYLREGSDVGQRSLTAMTGDQVVFRVKEAPRSPTASSDTAGVRDAAGSQVQQQQQQFIAPRSPGVVVGGSGSSSSSTPRASGAQVAMLGSPQVPVGLSSALGYLHLGQVARVKVPPHLMKQAVTDVEGAMEDMDTSASTGVTGGTATAAQGAQQGSASSQPTGSQPQQGGAHAAPNGTQQHGTAHPSDQPQPQQQQRLQEQEQEQGLAASHHPIDVVEAASKGSTPVHASHRPAGSSPGAHHHRHRQHSRLLQDRSPVKTSQQHTQQTGVMTPAVTPAAAAAAAAVVVTSDTVEGDGGSSSSGGSSAVPGHRRQHSDPKIIRPKGWLEQRQQQQQQAPVEGTHSSPAAPRGSSRVAAAAAHAAAASSDDPIRRAVAATMGNKSPSPAAAAAGSRPNIGSIPEASSARFPARLGEPAEAVPAAAAAAAAAGTAAAPSNSAFSAGSRTLQSTGRAASPAAGNRSPSPNGGGRSSSGFVLRADRSLNPARPHSSGTQGITFSKLSPQPSAEGVPPATPYPSPAAPNAVAVAGQAGVGGVRAFVSRLNQQQTGSTANCSSSAGSNKGLQSSPQPQSVITSASARDGWRHTPPAPPAEGAAAAAAAGGASNRRTSADSTSSLTSAGALARTAGVSGSGGNRRSSAGSISSSSNAGYFTPPASAGTPFYTPGSHTPQSALSANSDADSTVGGSTVSSNSTAVSGNHSSRQGPPPRSLLTLEGLQLSPRPAQGTAATMGAAAGAGSGVGSASSASSTTAGGGRVLSPKAAGLRLAAVLPQQQQQQQQQQSGDSRAAGFAALLGAERGRAADGRGAARELKFSSSTAGGGPAVSRTSPQDSSAVLQAAADKLRTQFPTAATAAAPSASGNATGVPTASLDTEAKGEERGSRINSSSVMFAAAEQRDTAGVRDTAAAAAAGRRPSGDALHTEDLGPASFAKWLPSDTAAGRCSSAAGKGSAGAMGAAAAMAAAAKGTDSAATGAGRSSLAAGSGSSSAGTGRASEAAAMAAALQPGFNATSVGFSSGRTVTQSMASTASESGEGQYNLQNYPSARHSEESFGGTQASAEGSAWGATAAAATAGATAPPATPHVSAASPVVDAGPAGLDGAAGTELKAAPAARLVSPSKAAAASALSGYSAAQAGAPAAPVVAAATGPAASAGGRAGHYKGAALLDLQQLQGRAAVSTAAAAGGGAGAVPGSGSGVNGSGAALCLYVRPIEHALMPGQQHSFTSARSSSISSSSGGGGEAGSLLAASSAASKPPAASSAAVDRTAETELSEVLPAEGSVEGVEGAAAAPSPAAEAPGARDARVEYEVEVLGIIPGHGPLSGQPVLSEAAQQENLTRADVRAAASAAASAEPQLKPPKPRKGFTGWVRRHLSLNINAPWRAGKAGASAVGLRGCFGGKKRGQEEQQRCQQQPMYGTSGT